MKRGTVCSIFKLKALRKPEIDKMIYGSSTLTREAVMSVSIYFRAILQVSEDSMQLMKISQVLSLQEKSITLRFNSIRCADRCQL